MLTRNFRVLGLQYSTIKVLYHFVQFGRPLSPAQVVWTKPVPYPLSPTHVADTKMWFEKRVKIGNFRNYLLQSVFPTIRGLIVLDHSCTLIERNY